MDTADKTTSPTLPTVQSKSDFWAAWVLANWIASLAARWVLDGFQTYDQLSGSHIPAPFNGLVAGAAIGVVAAIFQWLMLRRQVYQTTKWSVATFLGWTVGMLVGWPLLESVGGVLGEIAAFAFVGFTIGLLQWLTLRTQIYRAGWWIPASSLAWATGLYIIGWVIAGFVFIRLWQRPKINLPVIPVTQNTTDATLAPTRSKSAPSPLRRDLILVAQWVGLSILAQFALFFGSSFLIIFFVFLRNLPVLILVIMAIAWAVGGMLVGLLQSLILQKHFPRLKQWVLFTTLGWALSGEIVGLFAVTGGGFTPVRFSVAGAAAGLLLGTMQWVVLRGNVRKAFLWIFANILGGAIGGVGGFPIVGLFLIVIGMITGPLLVWFLRHPIQKSNRTKSISTISG